MAQFPFDIVGFDLDGTLVDSNRDLAPAINHALAVAGRPAVSPDETRKLIGGGARRMLERAMEVTGGALPEDEFEAAYGELLAHYAEHHRRSTPCPTPAASTRSTPCSSAAASWRWSPTRSRSTRGCCSRRSA